MCLDFDNYQRNENRGENVKINQNPSEADDRQLAANKARPISIEFLMSSANASRVKEWIYPL